MDSTLERILEEMKNHNISVTSMEKYLNIPKGSFSNWKRGMGKLYYSHIDKIADKLGVSIDYLIRGKELNQSSLTQQESELIDNFRQMSLVERKELLAKTNLIVGKKNN